MNRRIPLGLVGVTAVVAVAIGFFYCPCGRLPGGWLTGVEVAVPIDDWSFANDVPLCQVEVRALLPHSVNLNCMASRGQLYLSCSKCAGKRWSETALTHPDGRIRVNQTMYRVRFTRLQDPAQLDEAWQARASKLSIPPDTPRPDAWWSFRVESR